MPSNSSAQMDLLGGKVHLNKVCPNGRCRLGPTVHLQKTEAPESHDAILHGLDRKVGRLFFGKEPFEPTVTDWTTKPLVFAQLHPNPKDPAAKVNPAIFGFNREFTQDELDRINGAIVGELSESHIDGVGHPRLMVTKNYTDETAIRMFGQGLITEDQLARSQAAVPVALKLLAEGRLSHSSGFICPDDGEKLTGTVIPNHVLEFEETPVDQPVDRMAVVLNKQETQNVTPGNSHTNIGKVISNKNESRLKTALDAIMLIFKDAMKPEETTTTEPAAQTSGPTAPAPAADSKVNSTVIAEGTMNTPDGESLEGQIANVRRALSATVGLKWPDGSSREVWTVMTLPDQVIWQHPDTSQYYTSPYTVADDGTVSFTQPSEVEQAYVVKEANNVFTNMTAEDIDGIVKRNKVQVNKMSPEEAAQLKAAQDALTAANAEVARLQKETKDLLEARAQVQKAEFDAKWDGLRKTTIPPGELKDPANEAKLQKMSAEDPLGFAALVASWKKVPAKGEEGASHVNKGTESEDPVEKQNRILGQTSRIPGTLHSR